MSAREAVAKAECSLLGARTAMSRDVVLLGFAERMTLHAALEARGTRVRACGDIEGVLTTLSVKPDVPVVAAIDFRDGVRRLDALLGLLRLFPALELALVVHAADKEAWRAATRATPWIYPAEMPDGALADMVVSARGVRDPTLAATPRRGPASRCVVVRLGEGVEVDGRPIYLGVAERNFLFLLATRSGVRIAKTCMVDSGPGRQTTASSCRRRLGHRLTPELAGLLVPEERFDPYRLRDSVEIEAHCAMRRTLRTTLRIIGRGEISLVGTRTCTGRERQRDGAAAGRRVPGISGW